PQGEPDRPAASRNPAGPRRRRSEAARRAAPGPRAADGQRGKAGRRPVAAPHPGRSGRPAATQVPLSISPAGAAIRTRRRSIAMNRSPRLARLGLALLAPLAALL